MTFFTTRFETEQWLEARGITDYKIQDNLEVDVAGDVRLSNRNLDFFPVQFRYVFGQFSCEANWLSSLRGCPEYIRGDFFCGYNDLVNLKYCPKTVRGRFHCVENQLNTLEWCPDNVGKTFECSGNKGLGNVQHITNWAEIRAAHLQIKAIQRERELLEATTSLGASPTSTYRL